jgi:hypothetical protein
MISRIDQQIRVNETMIDFMKTDGRKVSGRQWRFLVHYLGIIMTITSVLLIRSGEPDALEKKKKLWVDLKNADFGTWLWIRLSILGFSMNLPGKNGRKISSKGYELAQKFYGFN